jgi:ATP-binding cassette, subfamily F, member 1
MSKNVSLQNISVLVPGKTLIEKSNLNLEYGQKYGLVGQNGIGKTTLLKQMDDGSLPIEKNIDMFYVSQELEFDNDKTIYQIVLDANRKRMKLTKRLDEISKLLYGDSDENEGDVISDENEGDENEGDLNEEETDKLMIEEEELRQKLTSMDYMKDDSIIRKILFGLGFSHEQHNCKYSQFSGGWKMRVSLARGLYMKPTLLMLDEPTNHLDLNAVIWLTNYLTTDWKKGLIIVSHDSYFLNEVCTNIIHIDNKKLNYYKGNYDSYKKQYNQRIKDMEKQWKIIENKIKEMKKKNIPRKETQKFLQDNEALRPPKPYDVNIRFQQATSIKWPSLALIDVSFGYENANELFDEISLSLYEGEKITIVGNNGVGKSTLLQMLMGTIQPRAGEVTRDQRLRIGFYNQHVSDVLPTNTTPVEYLQTIDKSLTIEKARKVLGDSSLPGSLHLQQISTLSGGQKARVVIASLTVMNPHILLLDEPTNHLDVETIDSLINAINEFNGAVLMVTHNIDMIQKTESLIYELEDQKLVETTFESYLEKVLKATEDL